MQWQRSEHQQPHSPRQPSLPGSEALRLAALQASWRRDRRVARRRIAWRWMVWYARRYLPWLVAALALLIVAGYLSGRLPAWSGTEPRLVEAEAAVYSPAPMAVSVATAAAGHLEPVAETDSAPLKLQFSAQIERTARVATAAIEAPTSPDTLTLTPENWLHSKEP